MRPLLRALGSCLPLAVALAAGGCGKAEPPALTYRVARSALELGRTPWDAPVLPRDTLSLLNLSEQSLLVTPLGYEGDDSGVLRWIAFPDYTEVRPGDSVSMPLSLVEDRTLWSSGVWTATLGVEVGAAWNDPTDFDVAPVWYEDQLEVTVAFELDCDLDGDGAEAFACGGPDCDDAGLGVPPAEGCSGARRGARTGDTDTGGCDACR